MRTLLTILASIGVLGAIVLTGQARSGASAPQAPVNVDPQAGGVLELVSATPYRLDEPYVHWYRAEQPRVDHGWLVVLGVSPDRVRPTNAAMPVLYAGDQTVEPVNFGHLDGKVVAFVPNLASLVETEFWFGDPELPERVDAAEIARQRTTARANGCLVIDEEAFAAARGAGGDSIELPSRFELEHVAARKVLDHAPGERERAEAWLPR